MSGDATLQRSVTLVGEPASSGAARRFVRELLSAADRLEWADAAELAVSEVVTNAVLHAHSDVEISVALEPDRVRVRVRDRSPTLPSQRDYDNHASTGRGLDLVAALTLEHGVESLGGAGKVVWFCVGSDLPELSFDDLLDQWSDGELDLAGPAAPAVGSIVLRGMPPTLWLAAREHHDALLRELALHLAGAAGPADPDLAAADRARFVISGGVAAEVEHARREGRASAPLPQYHLGALPEVPEAFDLRLDVSPEQVRDFAALQDALDEGERLAGAGRLLVHPGLPEIVAVRDWACEQVIAQLGGRRRRRGQVPTTPASSTSTSPTWPPSTAGTTAWSGRPRAAPSRWTTRTASSPSASRWPTRSAGDRKTWSAGGWWPSCRRASARRTWPASAGT